MFHDAEEKVKQFVGTLNPTEWLRIAAEVTAKEPTIQELEQCLIALDAIYKERNGGPQVAEGVVSDYLDF